MKVFLWLVVIAVLALAWSNRTTFEKKGTQPSVMTKSGTSFNDAVKRMAESASLAKSKLVIKATVRDPSSVKWNDEAAWTKDGLVNVLLDFTTLNGFGGPVRETWYFTFTPEGKAVSVLTPRGEELNKEPEAPSPRRESEKKAVESQQRLQGEVKQDRENQEAMQVAAQAAMEGKTLPEIEGTHGKALSRDPATGWAEWSKFRARFAAGKVVEVKLH